jgi:uncharacterized protein (TIGR00730 family)
MPLNYTLGEEIDDVVLDLIRRSGGTDSPDLIREIATTAFKLVGDGASRGDLKIMNSAMKELRYAFRLFAPFQHIRKVSIFGSARLAPESPAYALAERLARELIAAGMLVITGAGGGIMEAGNRGAGNGGSFGLAIRLPMEPEVNPYIRRPDRLINFKYFFTRKLIFIKESDAIALFPGGFGTMDECFELLTLLQTGKCDPRPVILMDPAGSGYWEEWMSFIRRQLADGGLISHRDAAFLTHATDPASAIREVCRFYQNYHSSRYVGDKLLIRLQHPPTDAQLVDWSRRFADITIAGGIERTEPPAEDRLDPLLASLHCVRFAFTRASFARLRELIDAMNDAVAGASAGETTAPPGSGSGSTKEA